MGPLHNDPSSKQINSGLSGSNLNSTIYTYVKENNHLKACPRSHGVGVGTVARVASLNPSSIQMFSPRIEGGDVKPGLQIRAILQF